MNGGFDIWLAGQTGLAASAFGLLMYWSRRFFPSPARDRDKLHSELGAEIRRLQLLVVRLQTAARQSDEELDVEREKRRKSEDVAFNAERRCRQVEDDLNLIRRRVAGPVVTPLPKDEGLVQ